MKKANKRDETGIMALYNHIISIVLIIWLARSYEYNQPAAIWNGKRKNITQWRTGNDHKFSATN